MDYRGQSKPMTWRVMIGSISERSQLTVHLSFVLVDSMVPPVRFSSSDYSFGLVFLFAFLDFYSVILADRRTG